MISGNQLARNLKVEILEAATTALLKTAVQEFFTNTGERVIVSVQYDAVSASLFTAFILYTE